MTGTHRSAFDRAALAIVVLGIALRVRLLAEQRPLWYDEAALAMNILGRTARELLSPLDFNQAAPIGFLELSRASVLLFGTGEWALRLPAWLGGILFLVVTWRLARTLFGAPAGLVAAGLAAVAPGWLYHAGELKPYMLDAGLSAVVALAAVRVANAPHRAGWWALLGALAALGGLVSLPLVFPLVGAAAYLVYHGRAHGMGDRRVRGGVLIGLATAASYLVLLRTAYSNLGAGTPLGGYMQEFWRPWLLAPWRPAFGDRVARAVPELLWQSLTGESASVFVVLPIGVALALGVAWLARRAQHATAVLCLTPIAALIGAALLDKYPLAERMALVVAPQVVLVLAAGIASLASQLNRRAIAVALSLWLFAGPAVALANGRIGPVRDDLRTVVRAATEGSMAPEPLYLGLGAMPGWLYYRGPWGAEEMHGSAGANRVRNMLFHARLADPRVPATSEAMRRDQARVVFLSYRVEPAYQVGPDFTVERGIDFDVTRIEASLNPCTLLLTSGMDHTTSDDQARVHRALAARGLAVVQVSAGDGARLHRVCSPRVPTAVPRTPTN